MSDYDREFPPHPPTKYTVGATDADGSFNNERPDVPDPWAVDWQRTLVTPLFVGGPADGHRDKPRPRCELPLRTIVPVPGEALKVPRLSLEVALETPSFGSATYRLGVYRDAFTVEYR